MGHSLDMMIQKYVWKSQVKANAKIRAFGSMQDREVELGRFISKAKQVRVRQRNEMTCMNVEFVMLFLKDSPQTIMHITTLNMSSNYILYLNNIWYTIILYSM